MSDNQHQQSITYLWLSDIQGQVSKIKFENGRAVAKMVEDHFCTLSGHLQEHYQSEYEKTQRTNKTDKEVSPIIKESPTQKETPLVLCHWITDAKGVLKKIKSVNGKAVAELIDKKFCLLTDKQQEYYQGHLNKYLNNNNTQGA